MTEDIRLLDIRPSLDPSANLPENNNGQHAETRRIWQGELIAFISSIYNFLNNYKKWIAFLLVGVGVLVLGTIFIILQVSLSSTKDSEETYYHHVAIYSEEEKSYCGGISDGISVITVAHCVCNDVNLTKEDVKIILFPIDDPDKIIFYPVQNISTHESYNHTTLDYDYAVLLLLLSKPVKFSSPGYKIRTPLGTETSKYFLNKSGSILGTIDDSNMCDSVSKNSRNIQLTVTDLEQCNNNNLNYKYDAERVWCVKSRNGPFNGDSGSPILVDNEIVGLVSGGDASCGENEKEKITTVVYFSKAILDWIQAKKSK